MLFMQTVQALSEPLFVHAISCLSQFAAIDALMLQIGKKLIVVQRIQYL